MNQTDQNSPFIFGGATLTQDALHLSARHGRSITASCIRCRYPICQCPKKEKAAA